MAATHSTMRNGKGNTVSSTAHDYAETMVENYQVRITTTLWPDGQYHIRIVDLETGMELRCITDHDDNEEQLRQDDQRLAEQQAQTERDYRTAYLQE